MATDVEIIEPDDPDDPQLAKPPKSKPATIHHERQWLKRCQKWKLDTPDLVLQAMAKIWRAYCGGHIRDQTYRMIFAGLKEIRAGREAEAARRTLQDMGIPFAGMTLIGPQQRSDDK